MYYKKLNSLFLLGLSLFSLVACKNNSPFEKNETLKVQTEWEQTVPDGNFTRDFFWVDTLSQEIFIASTVAGSVYSDTDEDNSPGAKDSLQKILDKMKDVDFLFTRLDKNGKIIWQKPHSGSSFYVNGSHNSFDLRQVKIGEKTTDCTIFYDGTIDTLPQAFNGIAFHKIRQKQRSIFIPIGEEAAGEIWTMPHTKPYTKRKLAHKFELDKIEGSLFFEFTELVFSDVHPNLQLMRVNPKSATTHERSSVWIATDTNANILWKQEFRYDGWRFSSLSNLFKSSKNLFLAKDGGIYFLSASPTQEYDMLLTKMSPEGKILFQIDTINELRVGTNNSTFFQLFEDNSFWLLEQAVDKKFTISAYTPNGTLSWRKEHPINFEQTAEQQMQWSFILPLKNGGLAAFAQIRQIDQKTKAETYKTYLLIFDEKGNLLKNGLVPNLNSNIYRLEAQSIDNNRLIFCAWFEQGYKNRHFLVSQILLQ